MLECFNENLCFYLSLGPWDDFRSCLDLQDWQRWDLCLKTTLFDCLVNHKY